MSKFNEHETMMVALYESREELEALFNNAFMKKYTHYNSFEEYTFSTAVFINWSVDFVVGDRFAFDKSVQGKTKFKTWEEMYQTALRENEN